MTTSNKPISLAGPVDADVLRTVELNKFLVEAGLYESVDESARREEVLRELDKIVKDWVKQLTSQRGYTDQMVEEANAVLFTFGSYRLGVRPSALLSHYFPLAYYLLKFQFHQAKKATELCAAPSVSLC
jgi:poly(A) polymerase Pap1